MPLPSQETSGSLNRFVLETIDPATECPIQEIGFDAADVAELAALLHLPVEEFDPRALYDLDAADVDQIKARFNLVFDPGNAPVRLRGRHRMDDLPYKVHTGRELAMMLAGTKPLAAFCGQYPPHPSVEEIPQRLFDPYVAQGRFVKREFVVPEKISAPNHCGIVLGIHIVLYALPHEEWRINAHILLGDVAAKSGWSEALERMEGTLLGYADWQNDIHIVNYRKQQSARRKASATENPREQ
jgi:hypothetical protein